MPPSPPPETPWGPLGDPPEGQNHHFLYPAIPRKWGDGTPLSGIPGLKTGVFVLLSRVGFCSVKFLGVHLWAPFLLSSAVHYCGQQVWTICKNLVLCQHRLTQDLQFSKFDIWPENGPESRNGHFRHHFAPVMYTLKKRLSGVTNPHLRAFLWQNALPYDKSSV